MKRYLLTGLIILSLGASACYRDNYVVQTSSISGQELRIEWKYKGDLMTSSINIPYLSERILFAALSLSLTSLSLIING